MKRNKYQQRTEQRILSAQDGDVFIPSDFFDIAGPTTIHKILERLVGKGILRKIGRGLYDKPLFSTFLQEFQSPNSEKVAHSLARNYGWNIVPTGDTALNLLGLSTQVSAHLIYRSDGPYREYAMGNITIHFKHTAHKNIPRLSGRPALVVQALLALGSSVVSDQVMLNRITKLLSRSEKKVLLEGSQHMTSWVFEAIKRVCV